MKIAAIVLSLILSVPFAALAQQGKGAAAPDASKSPAPAQQTDPEQPEVFGAALGPLLPAPGVAAAAALAGVLAIGGGGGGAVPTQNPTTGTTGTTGTR